MAVKTGVMGSSEPALVFSVVASLCTLQRIQTLKTSLCSINTKLWDKNNILIDVAYISKKWFM